MGRSRSGRGRIVGGRGRSRSWRGKSRSLRGRTVGGRGRSKSGMMGRKMMAKRNLRFVLNTKEKARSRKRSSWQF